MLNLILWRHAEAEDVSKSGTDSDRALTKSGHKDATKMAKWLNQHLPENALIFCSPATRCLETLAALQKLRVVHIEVIDILGIDSTPEIITKKLIQDQSDKTILIVGHQPNLGFVISKLLGMHENACAVKKGSVWWLRQRLNEGVKQTYLYAVQHPNL